MNILIFALAALGEGISGGDRIFIEFARRWSKDIPVEIFVWQQGFEMCQRQHLNSSSIKYHVSNMELWQKIGFIINYFARIIEGIKIGLTLKIANSSETIIYSASEFWMDCLPAFLIKIRYPKIKWAAAWYQTAPNPLVGFSEGNRDQKYKFSAFLYWLVQLPMKPLVANFADFVLVNNEEEKRQFPKLNRLDKTVVVIGAVDVEGIQSWINKHRYFDKIYDGVFQGRFHPQKGVVELVDIWKKVIEKIPSAKLAMIGDGPLMEDVKLKIKNEHLKNNINLFGYVFDGDEKYKIFSQGKVVAHPAFYDSGGMASAEAMIFGLPCVGFDLASYKSYYPRGMIKVKLGNINEFANQIIRLLKDKVIYNKVADDAVSLIQNNWSWDKRASQVLQRLVQ